MVHVTEASTTRMEGYHRNLEQYRHTLNVLQILADYKNDLCQELMKDANEIEDRRGDDIVHTSFDDDVELNAIDILRLCTMAACRKRNRLCFFNSKEGQMLRIQVKNHHHCTTPTAYYCALRGLRKESFRGRRSSIKCVQCRVNLCYKIVSGYRKSCSYVCHLRRKLSSREKACTKTT